VEEKLEPLKRRLLAEGLRPPNTLISRMKIADVVQAMKVSQQIFQGPTLSASLENQRHHVEPCATNAAEEKKRIFYTVDTRSVEERLKNISESGDNNRDVESSKLASQKAKYKRGSPLRKPAM